MSDDNTFIQPGKWDPIWFMSFCTDKELERISNPQNPKDILLRKRADIVADHVRYMRVFIKRRDVIRNYTFENCFSDIHYKNVIKKLDFINKEKVKSITYGDIFENDVNGIAWIENGNRFISMNESLKYFLYFCCLAFIPEWFDVPTYVRINSAIIATRIYYHKEAMDFELDPRGIIPKNIHHYINECIQQEMQFVAGHEIAHHLCNHLNESKIIKKNILYEYDKEYELPIFNIDQEQEFEADLNSIKLPKYTKKEFSKILEGAIRWFHGLEFIEKIDDVVNPGKEEQYQTHPSAEQRLKQILSEITPAQDINISDLHESINWATSLSDFISNDISTNYEKYDMYGSVYLDKPNSKWRGRELIDRKDY